MFSILNQITMQVQQSIESIAGIVLANDFSREHNKPYTIHGYFVNDEQLSLNLHILLEKKLVSPFALPVDRHFVFLVLIQKYCELK